MTVYLTLGKMWRLFQGQVIFDSGSQALKTTLGQMYRKGHYTVKNQKKKNARNWYTESNKARCCTQKNCPNCFCRGEYFGNSGKNAIR